MFHAVNKVILYRSGDPVKSRVLLLAPTGVAKININGNTVHSGLHIPCQGKLFPLNDANKVELINKYAEVELVIIDKIPVVSSKLFYQIQKRLSEIFSPRQDIPFGGKSVLMCGNLRELPPVRAKPVFTFNDTETTEGYINMDLCLKIRLAGLDQLMHQDDEIFVNMLNKIRVGEIDWNLEDVFKLHFIDKKDRCYPGNILHIFAENGPVKRHNDNQLRHIPGQLIIITAKDEVPKNFKISDIREAQNRKQSETGGLASLLELKVNARAMLTTNINIKDRLINRQMGTVKHIEMKENEVKTIYLELDDKSAGQIRMSGSDVIAKNNKWVPVKREETSIYLSKYKSTSPAIKRTQFPFVLSWACTVHKVQGLSLTSAAVSFDLTRSHLMKVKCMLS